MNEVSKTDQATTDLTTASRQIADVVERCGSLTGPGADIASAVGQARGMNLLKQILDSGGILQQLLTLQGSKLGFVTDKDNSPDNYPPEVIRDCIIEGLLRGAHVTNNEINIIAGNTFLTKNYYERMLRDLAGFDQFQYEIGLPDLATGGSFALIECSASWNMNGKPGSISFDKTGTDSRLSVKLNKGAGHDQSIGKAERKLHKAVWDRVNGSVAYVETVAVKEVVNVIESKVVENRGDEKVNKNEIVGLTGSLKRRIDDASFVEELEPLKEEIVTAKEAMALSHKDWQEVRDHLNDRYRILTAK